MKRREVSTVRDLRGLDGRGEVARLPAVKFSIAAIRPKALRPISVTAQPADVGQQHADRSRPAAASRLRRRPSTRLPSDQPPVGERRAVGVLEDGPVAAVARPRPASRPENRVMRARAGSYFCVMETALAANCRGERLTALVAGGWRRAIDLLSSRLAPHKHPTEGCAVRCSKFCRKSRQRRTEVTGPSDGRPRRRVADRTRQY